MVKGGGSLLLSTSDGEAFIVMVWPLVVEVEVVVKQETRTNFSEGRMLPFRDFNISHNRNAGAS